MSYWTFARPAESEEVAARDLNSSEPILRHGEPALLGPPRIALELSAALTITPATSPLTIVVPTSPLPSPLPSPLASPQNSPPLSPDGTVVTVALSLSPTSAAPSSDFSVRKSSSHIDSLALKKSRVFPAKPLPPVPMRKLSLSPTFDGDSHTSEPSTSPDSSERVNAQNIELRKINVETRKQLHHTKGQLKELQARYTKKIEEMNTSLQALYEETGQLTTANNALLNKLVFSTPSRLADQLEATHRKEKGHSPNRTETTKVRTKAQGVIAKLFYHDASHSAALEQQQHETKRDNGDNGKKLKQKTTETWEFPAAFSTLYEKLEQMTTVQPAESAMLVMSGPADLSGGSEAFYTNRLVGVSTSTYPIDPKMPSRRLGSPIADRFQIAVGEQAVIACLTDGSGWGENAKDASRIANDAFIHHCKEHLESAKSTQAAGRMLLQAIEAAHNHLLAAHSQKQPAGTTTLIGGILLRLNEPHDARKSHVFVCASVGDCKGFLFSQKRSKITTLRAGARTDLLSTNDPGGRIGPGLNCEADLRNLSVCLTTCDEDDVICLTSDGVSDNFDAQLLGKSPHDLGFSADTFDKCDPVELATAKELFCNQLLESFIPNSEVHIPQTSSSPPEKLSRLDARLVAQKLIIHSFIVTARTRDWYTTNTGRPPENSLDYPGKPDHCTCLAIQVSSQPYFELSKSEELFFQKF